VLRRERLAQELRLKDVAEAARISMPYLSEIERGRKEASSEVLAAAAHALGLGLADLLTLARDELARAAQASQTGTRAAVVSERDRCSSHIPEAGDGEPDVPAATSGIAQPAAPEARLATWRTQPEVRPAPAPPGRTPWQIQASLAA
jgi:transcriptional regulator with XRE-family HTH domain